MPEVFKHNETTYPFAILESVERREQDFYPEDVVITYPLFKEEAPLDTKALDKKIFNIFN